MAPFFRSDVLLSETKLFDTMEKYFAKLTQAAEAAQAAHEVQAVQAEKAALTAQAKQAAQYARGAQAAQAAEYTIQIQVTCTLHYVELARILFAVKCGKVSVYIKQLLPMKRVNFYALPRTDISSIASHCGKLYA